MSDLVGKTVLVTGATAGIGRETALGLAKLGAHVVIVGRDEARTKQVCDELRTASGNQKIDFLLADVSRLAEVRKLAADFMSRFGTLTVLVNNVGLVNLQREVSADGFELTFAVNHLAPFLLTKLLLPALERGAPSRIVNVSSDAHRGAKLDFDNLQLKKGYSSFGAYGRSKLMNILFTRELALRVAPQRITANSLHPGMVASNFMKKPGFVGAAGNAFMSMFGISPEKGARTSIFLAASPDVEGKSGRYYAKSTESQPSKYAQDDVAAKRLWDISDDLTK